MSSLRRVCLLGLAALLVSCGRTPSDSKVKADFLSQHPTWEVLTVGVGEGDAAAAYFHIKYKRPGDPQIYEEIWQYLNEGKGVWKLNHKESARPSR